MNIVESRVRELIKLNAVHVRKGTKLRSAGWSEVVSHLREEVNEFIDALPPRKPDFADAVTELGDVLGIVVHAALKMGITMKQLELIAVAKLNERFVVKEGDW